MTDHATSNAPTRSHSFQVVVDCQDPHELADWWAETLGWEVEPQSEDFIRSMIDQGFATEADTRVHRDRLVWREGAAINAPGAPAGSPRVLFQLVPEAKVVKNRLHLDVRAHDGDADALRASVQRRGATRIGDGRQGPHSWVVFTDPEGNEFCV